MTPEANPGSQAVSSGAVIKADGEPSLVGYQRGPPP